MNIRVLASVTFVMLGCVALYSSILMIHGLLSIPGYADEYEGNLFLIIVAFAFPMVLLVTGGVALITQRDRLASWAAGDQGKEEEGEEADPGQLPELAFALLGLYLVISTLPSLGSLAVSLIDFREWEDFESAVPVFRSNLGHYAGTLVQFAVGGYLFLYARSIGRWWRRRAAKRPEIPPSSPSTCPTCGEAFDPIDYRQSAEEKRCSNCGELLPDAMFG